MKYLIKNNSKFKTQVNIKSEKKFLNPNEEIIIEIENIEDIDSPFKEFIIISPYVEKAKKVEKIKKEEKVEKLNKNKPTKETSTKRKSSKKEK